MAITNYLYTGQLQRVTLPVGTHTIELWGADGSAEESHAVGKGGYLRVVVQVTSATQITLCVGEAPRQPGLAETTFGGGRPGSGNNSNWYLSGGGQSYLSWVNTAGLTDWGQAATLGARFAVAGGGGSGRNGGYKGGHAGGAMGLCGLFQPDQFIAGSTRETDFTPRPGLQTKNGVDTPNVGNLFNGGGGGWRNGGNGRVAGCGGSNYAGVGVVNSAITILSVTSMTYGIIIPSGWTNGNTPFPNIVEKLNSGFIGNPGSIQSSASIKRPNARHGYIRINTNTNTPAGINDIIDRVVFAIDEGPKGKIKYNGADVTKLMFNGTEVKGLIYNGMKVF